MKESLAAALALVLHQQVDIWNQETSLTVAPMAALLSVPGDPEVDSC